MDVINYDMSNSIDDYVHRIGRYVMGSFHRAICEASTDCPYALT